MYWKSFCAFPLCCQQSLVWITTVIFLTLHSQCWGGSCLWPWRFSVQGDELVCGASSQTQTEPEVKRWAVSFSNSEAVLFRIFGDGLSTGSRRECCIKRLSYCWKRSLFCFSLSLFLSLFLVFFSLKTECVCLHAFKRHWYLYCMSERVLVVPVYWWAFP